MRDRREECGLGSGKVNRGKAIAREAKAESIDARGVRHQNADIDGGAHAGVERGDRHLIAARRWVLRRGHRAIHKGAGGRAGGEARLHIGSERLGAAALWLHHAARPRIRAVAWLPRVQLSGVWGEADDAREEGRDDMACAGGGVAEKEAVARADLLDGGINRNGLGEVAITGSVVELVRIERLAILHRIGGIGKHKARGGGDEFAADAIVRPLAGVERTRANGVAGADHGQWGRARSAGGGGVSGARRPGLRGRAGGGWRAGREHQNASQTDEPPSRMRHVTTPSLPTWWRGPSTPRRAASMGSNVRAS